MKLHKMGLLSVALALAAALPSRGQPRGRYIVPGGRPLWPVWAPPALRPLGPGFYARVRVSAPTGFDWAFAVPPSAAGWAKALADYVPTRTTYQLYVPPTYNPRAGQPLVLFLSADNRPADFKSWEAIARKYGVIFASPHDAGADCPEARRVRMALDVLDDVRRRLHIDTDRCYLAGAGAAGRTACAVAFAYPEAFGGVLAIGEGSSLRPEPDRRERVRDRLSVALVTGERAPGQPELERYVAALLSACKVPMRLWTVPGADEAGPRQFEEVLLWLESSVAARRAQGLAFPASRLASGAVPGEEDWARALLQEGAGRVPREVTRVSGLMQLHAVKTRWRTTAAAKDAERQLANYNARARTTWEEAYRAEQQLFAWRQARAYHDYAGVVWRGLGAGAQAAMIRTAMGHWSRVSEHGKDTKMGQEAQARLERLRQVLAKVGG